MENKIVLVDTCVLYDIKENREGFIPIKFLESVIKNNKIAITPINLFELLCSYNYEDSEISNFLFYIKSNLSFHHLYYEEKFFDDAFLRTFIDDINNNKVDNYQIYRLKIGRYISYLYATYFSEFLSFLVVYIIKINIEIIKKKDDKIMSLTKKSNNILEGKMRQIYKLVESEFQKTIEKKKFIKSNINLLIQTILQNLMIPLMKSLIESHLVNVSHMSNTIGTWNQLTTNEYLLSKSNQTEEDVVSLSRIFPELIRKSKEYDKKVKKQEKINLKIDNYIDSEFSKIETNFGEDPFIKNYYKDFFKSAFSSKLNFDSNNIKDLALLVSFNSIKECDAFITSDKRLCDFVLKSDKYILQEKYIFVKKEFLN